MCCISEQGKANETEAPTKEQLLKKHAYSITAAEEVRLKLTIDIICVFDHVHMHQHKPQSAHSD